MALSITAAIVQVLKKKKKKKWEVRKQVLVRRSIKKITGNSRNEVIVETSHIRL